MFDNDSAREVAAAVSYNVKLSDELQHDPPWGEDAASAETTPAQWASLRFSGSLVSSLAQGNPCKVRTSSGRALASTTGIKWKVGPAKPETGTGIEDVELAMALPQKIQFPLQEMDRFNLGKLSYHNYTRIEDKPSEVDPNDTVESLGFFDVTGSVGCKSGKRAYFEVGVVRRGGFLGVGWRNKTKRDGRSHQAWVQCFAQSQHAFLLESFSRSAWERLSPGDRVFNGLDGRLATVTETTPAWVKLEGFGETRFYLAVNMLVDFQWAKFSARDKEVTGMAVVACAPKNADASITNAEQLRGNMAAVYRGAGRGEEILQEQTQRLIAAGAVGVVIINDTDELFEARALSTYRAEIPVVIIRARDAKKLLAFGSSSCLYHVHDLPGGQCYTGFLFHVAETRWDVHEGDVVGLECDLDNGKLRWSLNGDWSINNIDLQEVSLFHRIDLFAEVWWV